MPCFYSYFRASFRVLAGRTPDAPPPPLRPRHPARDPAPDFATRHDLHNYLYLRPTFGLLRPQPWAPLTDAEWAALRPILAEHGCGVADHPAPAGPWPMPAPGSTRSSAR
ncbi:hypothetical protein [Dankookia sp. P2]|uniref:hypothetical protein n=1 Tax=Dankookia sp. P2 TaxID=3423955 RepID=UPI003D66AAE4